MGVRHCFCGVVCYAQSFSLRTLNRANNGRRLYRDTPAPGCVAHRQTAHGGDPHAVFLADRKRDSRHESGPGRSRNLLYSRPLLKKPRSYRGGRSLQGTIFVSHASKDSRLVTELVYAFSHGLNIPQKTFFCSIPHGQSFIDYIKGRLEKPILVIFVVSTNFLASHSSNGEFL